MIKFSKSLIFLINHKNERQIQNIGTLFPTLKEAISIVNDIVDLFKNLSAFLSWTWPFIVIYKTKITKFLSILVSHLSNEFHKLGYLIKSELTKLINQTLIKIGEAKITELIMGLGLILLIPIGFVHGFFAGLQNFTEKQNVLLALFIAFLYFGSTSMFVILQYRILKSTSK